MRNQIVAAWNSTPVENLTALHSGSSLALRAIAFQAGPQQSRLENRDMEAVLAARADFFDD